MAHRTLQLEAFDFAVERSLGPSLQAYDDKLGLALMTRNLAKEKCLNDSGKTFDDPTPHNLGPIIVMTGIQGIKHTES